MEKRKEVPTDRRKQVRLEMILRNGPWVSLGAHLRTVLRKSWVWYKSCGVGPSPSPRMNFEAADQAIPLPCFRPMKTLSLNPVR